LHAESDLPLEEETPGWISMVDSLMLTTVLLFGLVLVSWDRLVIAGRAHTSLVTSLESRASLLEEEKRILVAKIRDVSDELEEARATASEINELSGRIDQLRLSLELAQCERDQLLDEIAGNRDSSVAEKMINEQLEQQLKHVEGQRQELERSLKRAEMRLADADAELANYSTRIEALMSERETLEGHVTQIQAKLKQETDERRRLDRIIEQMKGSVVKAETDLKTAQEKAERYESSIRNQSDRVLRPLTNALLAVRIKGKNARDDLDLDLYVQDPQDRLCYWRNPRVDDGESEVGTLIPSELLMTLQDFDESTGRTSTIDEAFYSMEFDPSSSDRPYLVFGMLRETGSRPTGSKIDQEIEWEVVVRPPGQSDQVLNGTVVIPTSGRVLVQKSGQPIYTGLVPLFGFSRLSRDTFEPVVVVPGSLPKMLRGWEEGKASKIGRAHV